MPIPNELENCIIKISEAITNINHNSTVQAEQATLQTKAIIEITGVLKEGNARQSAEHVSILEQIKQQWKTITLALMIVAGLVGLKLYLP